MRRAVEHVNTVLGPALIGLPVHEQAEIDDVLRQCDTSPGFAPMGADAVLALSLAAS